MTLILDCQIRPFFADHYNGNVYSDGGDSAASLSDGIGTLSKSLCEQLFVAGSLRRTLKGSQFCFGPLEFGERFGVHLSSLLSDRTGDLQNQPFGDRIDDVDRDPGSKITRRSAETPVGLLFRTHRPPAPSATDDPLQEPLPVSPEDRGRLLTLDRLEQDAIDNGRMSGRIVPFADRDLSEVYAVPEDLPGGRCSAIEDLPDLPPRTPGGSTLEGSTQDVGIRTGREFPILPFQISERDLRHRPDPEADRPFLRFGQLDGVTFAFHRGQGQEDVSCHASLRRGRIDVLGDGDDLSPRFFDPLDHGQGGRHLHPGKPVHLRDDDSVELPELDPLNDLLEDRPARPSPGDVEFGREDFDRPSPDLRESPDPLLLEFRGDQVFPAGDPADPHVSSETHRCGNITPLTTERGKVSAGVRTGARSGR